MELIPYDDSKSWDFSAITADTYLDTKWLEYLAFIYIDKGKSAANIELEKFATAGSKVGFRSAKKFWNDYLEETNAGMKDAGSDLTTEFAGQPIRLKSGNWTCDDSGITKFDYKQGYVVACRHPIIPIERIINVDTGFEQLRLAYQRAGTNWWNKSIVAPKSLLASPNKIIELADRGISVTADNAKQLISYLQEIEDLNYKEIPELRSTGRLGWISDAEFSPYAPDLKFDDSSSFARQYKSVKAEGQFESWLKLVSELRQKSTVFRIVLAASFASVLLDKLDVLPAFVHLWASQSSTGKTVAIMVAASVWGDPSAGAYVQSYNATSVAMERLAEFYNSMPLILDELQQAKDNQGRGGINVYKLAQGSGKARSNRAGGLEKTPTWSNFIISSGESPLVESSDGEGALARVINIELTGKLVDPEEGNRIVRTIKENHGHAGRRFIEALQAEGSLYSDDVIKAIYDEQVKELTKSSDVQDKQAMSAAAIITGDMLASQIIFDDAPITISDLKPYLLTKTESSIGNRAMEFIRGWISQYGNRFLEPSRLGGTDVAGEVYGQIESDCTFIIGQVFDNAMRDAGFNPSAVLSNWKQAGLIRVDNGRTKIPKRINGGVNRCVGLLGDKDQDSQLPFQS